MKDYLCLFGSKEFPVAVKYWSQLVDRLDGATKLKGRKSIVVEFDETNYSISVVGFREDYEKFMTLALNTVREIKLDQNVIAEAEPSYSLHEIRLLQKVGYINDLSANRVDSSSSPSTGGVQINLVNGVVVFTGSQHEVAVKKIEMSEKLKTIVSDRCHLEDFAFKLLNLPDFESHILNELKLRNIQIIWGKGTQRVRVFGFSYDDVKSGIEILLTEFYEFKIPLSESASSLLQHSEWKKIKVELKEEFSPLLIQEAPLLIDDEENVSGELTISCTCHVAETLRTKIQNFIDEFTVSNTFVSATRGSTAVVARYRKDALCKIEEDLQSCSLRIVPKSRGFEVSGTKSGLQRAIERIDALVKAVFVKLYFLDKSGMSQYFHSDRGQKNLKSIESRLHAWLEVRTERDEERRKEEQPVEDDSDDCSIVNIKTEPDCSIVNVITEPNPSGFLEPLDYSLEKMDASERGDIDSSDYICDEDDFMKLQDEPVEDEKFAVDLGRPRRNAKILATVRLSDKFVVKLIEAEMEHYETDAVVNPTDSQSSHRSGIFKNMSRAGH